MRLVWGTVSSVEREVAGAQDLRVSLDDGREGRAVSYPSLAGICEAGERVLLNTTAVDLALGTGGNHFVVARQGSGEGVVLDVPSPGHVMKLRYTPLQVDVIAVESQESPHHAVMRRVESLLGMPVVCCGLHSQVPLVAAAIKRADSTLRVAYCMTDDAALPIALSDVVRACADEGLLDTTVTCGQAFGGDLEAVNLHSGLLAARHVAQADVAIVALGPGVVGTATPFGHGGIAQGEAVNAASVLGGVPVVCLRVSFADARERHRGVSHHTLAALTKVALAPAHVAIPSLPEEFSDAIEEQLDAAGVAERHRLYVSAEGRVAPPPLCGVRVTTMGRSLADDPAFFAAAFAAGDIASQVALGTLK